MSDLVDKWNTYKNALRDMLTKPNGTVDMEDGIGNIVTLPTFPALQKLVSSLTDQAAGAVAGAQASASSAARSANDASRSEEAAAVSAEAAKDAQDAATASQNSAAVSANNAALSESHAASFDSSASASAISAAESTTAAKTSETNAASSATSAQASSIASASARDLADMYANAPVNLEVAPGHYSAFHWSEKARLTALGSLIYRGAWDASGGSYPASPALGDFYLISKAGSMGSAKYGVGDMMLYDGSVWDRVDNQQTVTSVQGRTGAVTLTWADFGYVPAEAGTGVGQSNSKVKLGWAADGSGKLKCTIDVNDQGNIAMESWVSSNYLPLTGGGVNGSISANTFKSASGAAGEKFRIGDDCTLWDIDVPNATGVKGAQDGTKGFIRFGNDANSFGFDGSRLSYTGEFVSNGFTNGSGQHRLVAGNRGVFWRFDGANLYLMGTASGDPYGTWNTFRPLSWDVNANTLSTNSSVTVNGALTVNAQLNGGIIYGTDSVGSGVANGGNGGLRALTAHANGGGAAVMTFIRDGNFGCYLGIDTDNALRIGGWSMGNASYRILHEGIGSPTFWSQLQVNNADIRTTNWVYAANFQVNSDARLKTPLHVLDARTELDRLNKLIARCYIKDGHVEYGFFAQELHEHYPSIVKCGEGPAGDDTLTVSAMELLAPIVAAIQGLDRRLKNVGL